MFLTLTTLYYVCVTLLFYYLYILYYALLFSVKHIRKVDGLTGCYRGLMPRMCSYAVSTIASQKTAEYLQLEVIQIEDEDEEDELVRYIPSKKWKVQYKSHYDSSHLQT